MVSDRLGITFPAYERKFYNPDRAYLLVDSDYYKLRHLIKCFSFSSRSDMNKFFNYFEKDKRFVNFVSDDDIENMELPFKRIFLRLKAYDDIKGLNIGFRPNSGELIKIYRIFPHITHLFMGASYAKGLSYASIEFLNNIWGLNVEIGFFMGVRVDLGVCFQVEVYD